ncbi:MAG: hypothetical protein U0Q16_07140 [Bryobacteraceae bacterium]
MDCDSNQTWLTASPSNGTAPSNVSVGVSTAGLAAGTYNGTVTVTAPGAPNSPKTIAVTLNVAAVSPASLTFNGAGTRDGHGHRTHRLDSDFEPALADHHAVGELVHRHCLDERTRRRDLLRNDHGGSVGDPGDAQCRQPFRRHPSRSMAQELKP